MGGGEGRREGEEGRGGGEGRRGGEEGRVCMYTTFCGLSD